MDLAISKGKAISEGKSKILYATSDSEKLLLHYKDAATAFNGEKKGAIASKGIINNWVCSWVFRYLESHGIPTHFLEKTSDRECLVQKLRVIPVEVVIASARKVAAEPFLG